MKETTKILSVIGLALRRYVVVITIVIFGAMYGYLIITSGKQAESQPSEVQINEKVQSTSRPKMDEDVASKLLELEEQNIEIKSLFEYARNNPFSE